MYMYIYKIISYKIYENIYIGNSYSIEKYLALCSNVSATDQSPVLKIHRITI